MDEEPKEMHLHDVLEACCICSVRGKPLSKRPCCSKPMCVECMELYLKKNGTKTGKSNVVAGCPHCREKITFTDGHVPKDHYLTDAAQQLATVSDLVEGEYQYDVTKCRLCHSPATALALLRDGSWTAPFCTACLSKRSDNVVPTAEVATILRRRLTERIASLEKLSKAIASGSHGSHTHLISEPKRIADQLLASTHQRLNKFNAALEERRQRLKTEYDNAAHAAQQASDDIKQHVARIRESVKSRLDPRSVMTLEEFGQRKAALEQEIEKEKDEHLSKLGREVPSAATTTYPTLPAGVPRLLDVHIGNTCVSFARIMSRALERQHARVVDVLPADASDTVRATRKNMWSSAALRGGPAQARASSLHHHMVKDESDDDEDDSHDLDEGNDNDNDEEVEKEVVIDDDDDDDDDDGDGTPAQHSTHILRPKARRKRTSGNDSDDSDDAFPSLMRPSTLRDAANDDEDTDHGVEDDLDTGRNGAQMTSARPLRGARSSSSLSLSSSSLASSSSHRRAAVRAGVTVPKRRASEAGSEGLSDNDGAAGGDTDAADVEVEGRRKKPRRQQTEDVDLEDVPLDRRGKPVLTSQMLKSLLSVEPDPIEKLCELFPGVGAEFWRKNKPKRKNTYSKRVIAMARERCAPRVFQFHEIDGTVIATAECPTREGVESFRYQHPVTVDATEAQVKAHFAQQRS
ncbi:hypothetical protein PTSG_08212 [Salpingoeca rosetta]|uniref:Cytochrome c domain-containing protein n=1 Tax=Salpingoeca rosetta (strain ATCC 50818 / BSB-021) TaxID=946362 RepID=F2UIB5_SALR5|nr:uncharacterized protein PTSG_08212 [Salpingoeca rosetta]EGD76864.1 hypothetical protein PTSG_08212 [Salpingoeca rosetta]|eukprot:XP_004991236.1 hypothetical protein PTSG_08212 [Salpingoeca rosetta]